jgi:hypothetical protein
MGIRMRVWEWVWVWDCSLGGYTESNEWCFPRRQTRIGEPAACSNTNLSSEEGRVRVEGEGVSREGKGGYRGVRVRVRVRVGPPSSLGVCCRLALTSSSICSQPTCRVRVRVRGLGSG